MNICTVGDGEHIGDWRVVGDGAHYLIQRLDPITVEPHPSTMVGKEWVTLGDAITPPVAVQLLTFFMQQDSLNVGS